MECNKKIPVVGILFDKRGDPPYLSVGKLWKETVCLISEKYQMEIFEVNDFAVENKVEYWEFINRIDLLMVLSPYYLLDRTLKQFPVVVYGLGSMQKGGHWLHNNRNSFKSYDSIILNSTVCQNIYDELAGSRRMKTYLIPFGVDTNIFHPSNNKVELRRKYNVPKDAFVLVYSGRINLQKNPHLLIGLLRDLVRKYDNILLMYIGSFDNFYIPEFLDKLPPDMKIEFDKLIHKFDLKSKIKIFDNQSDPQIYSELLSMADLGINLTTLISENFGYTPVEMQACGIPVIGTDWGGLRNTIIDGKTGFHIKTVLSKYGARINLKQAFNRIEVLINDRKLLKEMSIKARQNVKKNYSHLLFACNVQNIIQETYDEFIKVGMMEQPIKCNPIVERMSNAIKKKYGCSRHISWEHLHPLIDFDHYKLIASKCVTEIVDNIVWKQDSLISKGFDWTIKDGDFISHDPRWDSSFELVNWNLTENELLFLKLIDDFDYSTRDLLEKEQKSWEEVSEVLQGLTRKGLLIPMDNKELLYVNKY